MLNFQLRQQLQAQNVLLLEATAANTQLSTQNQQLTSTVLSNTSRISTLEETNKKLLLELGGRREIPPRIEGAPVGEGAEEGDDPTTEEEDDDDTDDDDAGNDGGNGGGGNEGAGKTV